jgi:hypothetical protein
VQFFRKIAERRERDEREARMLVRRHGEEALIVLDDRIAKSGEGRAKAHWKRVQKLARDYVRHGIPATVIDDANQQPA